MTLQNPSLPAFRQPLANLLPPSPAKSTSTDNSPAAHKLRKAAAEFESILISNLWKSMKTTFADSDDDQSIDPAHDSLEDWGIHAMSTAVASAGGFGIGALILKHLDPLLQPNSPDSQNGNQLPYRKGSGPPADIS